MKIKMAVVALVAGAWIGSAHADELKTGTTTAMPATTPATTNTTTIAASTLLSPGQYLSTVAPNFNSGMADRLAKAIAQIPGIKSVTASAEESTIHFTVKNGSHVHVADIQKAVAKVDTGAVTTPPVLEPSHSPIP